MDRIWGANLATWTITGQPKDVSAVFADMASCNANGVRINHHDESLNWPGIFNGLAGVDPDPLKRTMDTATLNEPFMLKLDYAIAEAKRAGLAVWLDCCNRRQLVPSDFARLPARCREAYDHPMPGCAKGEFKGYLFAFQELQDEVARVARLKLTRVNTITKNRYVDDVDFVLLLNEYDYVNHSSGPWVGGVPTSEYTKQCITDHKAFLSSLGLVDNKVTNERFAAWYESTALGRIRAQLADLPIKNLITHSYWGNNPLSALNSLAESPGGVDLHVYSRNKTSDPNLFACHDERQWPDLETLVGGCRIQGRKIGLSEIASVVQGVGNAREADVTESVLAASRCNLDWCFHFAWTQGGLNPLYIKDQGYNLGLNPAFREAFKAGAVAFKNQTPRAQRVFKLSDREKFGVMMGPTFHRPSAWTEPWLRQAVIDGVDPVVVP